MAAQLLWMLVLKSLQKPFQNFTGCHEGSKLFHLFLYTTHSWQFSVVWSHNSIQLLQLSGLIISTFWGIIIVTCFLLPAAPCLHILGSSEALIITYWAQLSPDNTESVHILDIINDKTSNLWPICLNYRSIRISRESISTVITTLNQKVQGGSGLQWHKTHSKYYYHESIGSTLQWKTTELDTNIHSHLINLCFSQPFTDGTYLFYIRAPCVPHSEHSPSWL